MCLSTQSFLLFLSLLSPDIVEHTDPGVVIHAETRAALWRASGEHWCTTAPQIDARIRLRQGETL